MIRLTILTEFNTITIDVEDTFAPEVQEIFNQPYVRRIDMDEIPEELATKRLVLTRKR